MSELRNKLKGAGIDMGSVAEKLGMSRQNLNYHLSKVRADANFREKLHEAYPQLFKSEPQKIEQNVDTKTLQLLEELIREKDTTIELLREQIQLLNERNIELIDRMNRSDNFSKQQNAM